jgi:hypothetical protein
VTVSRYPPKKPAAKKAPAKKVVKQKGKAAAAVKRSKPRKVLTNTQRVALAAENAKPARVSAEALYEEVERTRTAKRFRFRDAITGFFVRARDALRRKSTTVRERV